MSSVSSKAHRPRTKWYPAVQKSGEEYEFFLKYRNSSGIMAPYSNSPQQHKVKVPWGPPSSCCLGTSEVDGRDEHFFRFSLGNSNVKFFASSLNPLAESVNPLSQTVQSMVTDGKLELLADYFSLLNQTVEFVRHHQGIFSEEGLRIDGEGIQEGRIVQKGGSIEHLKMFIKAARDSAQNCAQISADSHKRKSLGSNSRGKQLKLTAEQRFDKEVSETEGVEKQYSKSFVGSADVALSLLDVDPVLKSKVRYFHVNGIKNEMMKRFDPSLLSITVRPRDLANFNSEKVDESQYYVVQGIHSFRALQEINREGKLSQLPTLKEGLITVHVVNIEDNELVLYGNVRSNSLASVFIRKPQPQVKHLMLIFSRPGQSQGPIYKRIYD